VDEVLADAGPAREQVVHRRADEGDSGLVLEALRYQLADAQERRARILRLHLLEQRGERAVLGLVARG
jgi:hypothetical protein